MFSTERLNARPTLLAGLAGALLCLACAASAPSALAQAPQFTGHWKSDNPASAAPDAVLTIEGASLSWRPKRHAPPMCSGTFALQAEKPGSVYVDGRGKKFVGGAIGSFPTYLLKVDPGTCGGGADSWRLSFPLAYDRVHMALTEYRNGRPIGFRRLRRVD
jgi:hypothetical protein